ncbi:uncharacterized protein LOC62_01G000158 [Vanrija pseudolonga]|uniref:Uncharacterized protein n=1 Tax=Vanrija pseudolonga TaxID=143232 RepID=A0AAF0Y2T7_9TREE|nr:hypothetical protein LOC62_01G000158 [Vanrija pseudolonga]
MNPSTSLATPPASASASASASPSLGDFGPNGSPSAQSSVIWPGPMNVGQVVCAAGLYNVTDACCLQLHGALWVPDPAGAAGMPPTRQHACLFFSNTTTADATITAFKNCASRPGTGDNVIPATPVLNTTAVPSTSPPTTHTMNNGTASLSLTSPPVPTPTATGLGPNGDPAQMYPASWPGAMYAGQTVCAASVYNVTDMCCARLHGALWVGDDAYAATTFGSRQHMCLLFSNATTANATRDAFTGCAYGVDGVNPIVGCKIHSGAARTVVGIGMLLVAVGSVLAL